MADDEEWVEVHESGGCTLYLSEKDGSAKVKCGEDEVWMDDTLLNMVGKLSQIARKE